MIDDAGKWTVRSDVKYVQVMDYHYYDNAETYMEVGNGLGWAMVGLLKK